MFDDATKPSHVLPEREREASLMSVRGGPGH